jgi:pimeloyl-ACP methyl ester carboxylesterase
MAATRGEVDDHLVWKRATVAGRTALYGVAGSGPPVLFLHGWGLGQHAYKRSLKRLVALGCTVWAPALPGFGGTPDLPGHQLNFAGYAEWVDEFCQVVGIDEPVFLVGHSFGGGCAIQFAHDHPERVRYVVLINSVGGAAWKSGKGGAIRSIAERPLWDWGLHFPADVLPLPQITKVLPVILEDLVPNALRNPMAFWRVGQVARTADLRSELEELKRRETPVVVLWGGQDKVLPKDSFDALCEAIGHGGEVVAGAHNWLLADADAFGEVMTNVLHVAEVAREHESGRGPREVQHL